MRGKCSFDCRRIKQQEIQKDGLQLDQIHKTSVTDSSHFQFRSNETVGDWCDFEGISFCGCSDYWFHHFLAITFELVCMRCCNVQTLGNSAFQCCERTWPISRRWSCLVMPQTTNFVASMSDHHQCYLLVCLSGNNASIAYPYQPSIHHHRFNDERIAMWFHCPSDRPSIWIVLLRLCKAIIIILSGNCNFYNFVGSVCQLVFSSASDRPQFGTIWTQI